MTSKENSYNLEEDSFMKNDVTLKLYSSKSENCSISQDLNDGKEGEFHVVRRSQSLGTNLNVTSHVSDLQVILYSDSDKRV